MRRVLQLTIALVLTVGLWSSPAGATQNPDYTAPPPTTVVVSPSPTQPPVKTAVQVTPVRTRLAITGSDTTNAALVGTACILAGAGLLVLRRRKLASLS